MDVFSSRNMRRYWPFLVMALLFGETFTETPAAIAITLGLATSFWLVAVINLGGFSTLNGICVAALGVSEMLIPRVAKILYLQSADSRLVNPILYYDVLLVSCFLLYVISFFFRPTFERNTTENKWIFTEDELKIFTWFGFFWMLFSEAILTSNLVSESSQLAGIITYASTFQYFGFCCAIAYRIRKTNGDSNVNVLILFYGVFLTMAGVFGFWKEAMLTPSVLYILISIIHRFRWRKIHVLFFASFVMMYVGLISPAAKLGHNWVAANYGLNPTAAVKELFSDLVENPMFLVEKAYTLDEQGINSEVEGDYYGHGQNFLVRITTVGVADRLLNYVEKNQFFGTRPMLDAISIVPRSFKGEARFDLGNYLARKISIIGPDNFNTGIAFSFFSTAYAVDGWISLLILSCSLIPLFFWINNKYVGPMKNNLVAVAILKLAIPTFMGNSAEYVIFYATRIIPFQLLLIYAVRKILSLMRPAELKDLSSKESISQ